jgi:hypothetical protein
MSSERIHSRYLRHVTDLPLAGRPVRLVVVARRFRCGADLCGRRIFTERFEDGVLAPWARRTGRLDYVIHHLGLALGGRPAASFARRLMLPVSNDTLLRVVRRRGSPSFAPPTVVGIDDWAWRRNQRYGTIICDLERHKTDRLAAGPRTGHGGGLALWPATDFRGRPRPWRRLRVSCSQSAPECHPGCRPLASHGERQSRLP